MGCFLIKQLRRIKMPKEKQRLKNALQNSARAFARSLPVIFGIILLISLANAIIPKSFYTNIFRGNLVLDSFIGAIIGSISAGTPIASYILGGEFLKQGISLVAVTAFLVAWVTVGLIQLPAESIMLGKRFALLRNVLSFIFAIIVAVLTVAILGGLG